MCGTKPACAAYWRADAVFIGRVTANVALQADGHPGEILTTLAVLQTFRGEQRASIVLREPYTTCSYDFRIDETYLVFASRSAEGRLSASLCSGTKPLAEAAKDIPAIEALPSLPPLGWIYGTVSRAVRDAETRGIRGGVSIGVPVTLTSAGTRASILTDQDGRFEFTDLTPGTYSVQVAVPATMRALGGGDVVVTARSCSPVYLQMVNTARVSGRLYLSDGSPPPRALPIELLDADATAAAPQLATPRITYSSAEGRFTFEQVQPGRYYLGMNTQYPPAVERPYAPRWYPNAGSPTEAYLIDVGDGEQKTDFDFTLQALSESEIAAAVPQRRPAASPPDTRPIFSPQLFPRRGPRAVMFSLLSKPGGQQ